MSIATVTHVNLRGTAREALGLYRSVFGGEFVAVTYADAGAVQDPAEADQVMWGQVTSPDGFRVMAYDVPSSLPWDPGANAFFVSVRGTSAEEITGYWEGLSDGATIVQPLAPAGWSPLYGMLTDRFGVGWVLDVQVEHPDILNPMTVLTAQALNRATLARQLLLDRADLPVLGAVEHLAGLQAQEPQEPFVGLWSRLRELDPADLDALLVGRQVVRSHLMRCTVHLVASQDMLAWRSRHDAMLRGRMLAIFRAGLDGVDLAEFAEVARGYLADGEPRTMAELGQVLAARWPAPRPRAHAELAIACLVPVAQTPPRGLWRTKAGVQVVLLSSWLGRDVEPLSPDDDLVGQALVRRYLAAYGPAATADIRSWSGIAGLPAAVKAMRDELVSFRDERGRILWDLPDAPRPDGDLPAPVRFLPAFDNALLGYDDRTRIVDDAHRGLSVAGTRVVLVDGRVGATWTEKSGTVTVTPLRDLSAAERAAVADEGAATASFLTDGGSDHVVVG